MQHYTSVQAEVNFLLDFVEASGCAFYRNSTWHNAKEAQAHLRDKCAWLTARNLVDTTEAFIERAATKSSFTGRPYKVKCNGGATITSKQWLRGELTLMRSEGLVKDRPRK